MATLVRFYTDEHIPRAVIRGLRQRGAEVLTVREAGRPDQKCRILKTWKQPDGAMAFEVQCLETEEHLTLVEMAASEVGVGDVSKGMKSKIYHWGQNVTPPPGVPQMAPQCLPPRLRKAKTARRS